MLYRSWEMLIEFNDAWKKREVWNAVMSTSYNQRVEGFLPPVIVISSRDCFAKRQNPLFANLFSKLDGGIELHAISVSISIKEVIYPLTNDFAIPESCWIWKISRVVGKWFFGVAHDSGVNVAAQFLIDLRIRISILGIIGFGVSRCECRKEGGNWDGHIGFQFYQITKRGNSRSTVVGANPEDDVNWIV